MEAIVRGRETICSVASIFVEKKAGTIQCPPYNRRPGRLLSDEHETRIKSNTDGFIISIQKEIRHYVRGVGLKDLSPFRGACGRHHILRGSLLPDS